MFVRLDLLDTYRQNVLLHMRPKGSKIWHGSLRDPRSVVSSLAVFSPIMSRTRATFNGACTAAKLMRQDTMARFTATKRSEFPPRHGPPVSRCPRPIDSSADYVFIDSSFLACSLRTSNFIRVCRDVYIIYVTKSWHVEFIGIEDFEKPWDRVGEERRAIWLFQSRRVSWNVSF